MLLLHSLPLRSLVVASTTLPIHTCCSFFASRSAVAATTRNFTKRNFSAFPSSTFVTMAPAYAVNAVFTLKEDRVDEFKKIIKEDQKLTMSEEEGAIRFVVGEDKEKKNCFYLHEEYVNEDAFKKHGTMPHFKPWDDFTKTDPWAEGGEPVADFYEGTHESSGKKETIRTGHCVNAKFSILAERRDEFLKIINEDKEKTLSDEKGSIAFVIGEDKEKKNTFFLFEHYVDEEAFKEHCAAPHFKPWDEFTKTNPWAEGGEPVAGFYNTFMAPPYAVNAVFTLKEDRVDEFKKIIKEDQKLTMSEEEGAIRFVVGEDKEKKNCFYLHEEYVNEEAFKKHGTMPHFKPWDDFTKTDPWAEGGEPVADFYEGTHESSGKKETIRTGHCVNAKFSIQPEKRDEFFKIINEDKEKTLSDEKGSIAFVVGEDKEKINTFFLFEHYVDEEAFKEHCAAPHFKPWDDFTKTSPWSEGGEPVAGFYNTLPIEEEGEPAEKKQKTEE